MESMTHFYSTGLGDQELKELEDQIEDLVTKGDDEPTVVAVKMLSGFIVNTMIPNRIKAQKSDEFMLHRDYEALDHCHLDEVKKRDALVGQKLIDAKKHRDHHEDASIDHAQCLEVKEGKSMVNEAYCSGVEDVAKTCQCHEGVVKIFGRRESDVDCMNAPAHHTEIADKHKDCCDSYASHEQIKIKCHNHELKASYNEKQHAIIMGKLCETYDECYDDKFKVYHKTEKMVKGNEKRRGWATLFTIQCYVKEFKDGKRLNKEQAKACKKNALAEVHHIEFKEAPKKEQCSGDIDAKPM